MIAFKKAKLAGSMLFLGVILSACSSPAPYSPPISAPTPTAQVLREQVAAWGVDGGDVHAATLLQDTSSVRQAASGGNTAAVQSFCTNLGAHAVEAAAYTPFPVDEIQAVYMKAYESYAGASKSCLNALSTTGDFQEAGKLLADGDAALQEASTSTKSFLGSLR